MRKMLACILAMMLLASCLSLSVMPAAAQGVVVPGDKDGDKLVSKEELAV
ncbi:MAG: hypothetical protein QMD22_10705 [archaeon]|nr:hypothetical protein [archaeon]